jgi:hypothetical protein
MYHDVWKAGTMKAYVWVVAESLKCSSINGSSEAIEDRSEDMVGSRAQDAKRALERGQSTVLLELDNVLVGNESASIHFRDQERSRLVTLGWGAHCQRQDGEEDRQTHDDC